MKKHLLFLLFQVKASLRALPRILFSTVILALVVISVGFCGSKIMSTDAKKVNANIEIVIPPDDTTLLMAFQIYTNMDSIASIATCHLSESKEAAFDALEEGRAAAVVVIPSGFIGGILNGTMDTFASVISNNQNSVMKFLTTITIVLSIPTMIASFYGMNVKADGMPFANIRGGFIIVIGISLIISLIIALIFRKKDLF